MTTVLTAKRETGPDLNDVLTAPTLPRLPAHVEAVLTELVLLSGPRAFRNPRRSMPEEAEHVSMDRQRVYRALLLLPRAIRLTLLAAVCPGEARTRAWAIVQSPEWAALCDELKTSADETRA